MPLLGSLNALAMAPSKASLSITRDHFPPVYFTATPPKQTSSDEARDRFTTYWTGPYLPDALAYSARNGISYDYGGGSTMQFGGMFLVRSGPYGGGTDIAALRAANRAADGEERDRHTAGPNFKTGHALASNDRADVKRRIAVLEGELDNGEDERKREELDGLNADVPFIEEMLLLVAKLNQMVEDETKAGWDWEEGLDAQKAVRGEQQAVYERFNCHFEDLDLWHELVSIVRRSTNEDPAMM
ncbi:uncharacterized protein PAC_18171 [Phialocephala subalpina]|uniref:Uncharacterized protein n=1 Tax=Phialocephala subalpina TaxID=576137 RepID=A0A1L7XTA8_9HELO|nr:uncharacterized protein PAC_18171 [Phialocephala subalpina]